MFFMPVPGEKGLVMEYGRASRQPSVAARKNAIEETMAKYNAVYTMLWQKGADGDFICAQEYTLESRKRFSLLYNYNCCCNTPFVWQA